MGSVRSSTSCLPAGRRSPGRRSWRPPVPGARARHPAAPCIIDPRVEPRAGDDRLEVPGEGAASPLFLGRGDGHGPRELARRPPDRGEAGDRLGPSPEMGPSPTWDRRAASPRSRWSRCWAGAGSSGSGTAPGPRSANRSRPAAGSRSSGHRPAGSPRNSPWIRVSCCCFHGSPARGLLWTVRRPGPGPPRGRAPPVAAPRQSRRSIPAISSAGSSAP